MVFVLWSPSSATNEAQPDFPHDTVTTNTRITHRSHLFFNMSDPNGTTMSGTENVNPSESVTAPKGKGKAVDLTSQEVSMGEDDDSSDEETGAEEEVCIP